MRKLLVKFFFASLILILGISGCRYNGDSPDNVEETPQSVATEKIPTEKGWTEQEIRSLFTNASNHANQTIIDCVVATDFAFDRVGVVLFTDDEKQTSNVAFIGEDGYYQMCGVYAKTSDESELTYCGNGVVTFRLETEEGVAYNCKIALSIEDSSVNFIVEDDLKDITQQ